MRPLGFGGRKRNRVNFCHIYNKNGSIMTDHDSITPAEADLIARLNSERLSAEDLMAVYDAIHEMPAAMREWAERMLHLAKHFPQQKFRAMAADFRLTALSALLAQETLPPGMLRKTSDGAHVVPRFVFEVAALEPILLRGNQPLFDVESFRQRILELTTASGEA